MTAPDQSTQTAPPVLFVFFSRNRPAGSAIDGLPAAASYSAYHMRVPAPTTLPQCGSDAPAQAARTLAVQGLHRQRIHTLGRHRMELRSRPARNNAAPRRYLPDEAPERPTRLQALFLDRMPGRVFAGDPETFLARSTARLLHPTSTCSGWRPSISSYDCSWARPRLSVGIQRCHRDASTPRPRRIHPITVVVSRSARALPSADQALASSTSGCNCGSSATRSSNTKQRPS